MPCDFEYKYTGQVLLANAATVKKVLKNLGFQPTASSSIFVKGTLRARLSNGRVDLTGAEDDVKQTEAALRRGYTAKTLEAGVAKFGGRMKKIGTSKFEVRLGRGF